MNVEYTSISQFVEAASRNLDKVAVYDRLITAFENSMLDATASGHYLQYEMDDSQIKVRVQYRNMKDMVAAMDGLIKLRQMYINRNNGGVTRFVGGNL